LTIVVKDTVGNPVAGLASNAFSFSLGGGTSTGSFGAVTSTSTPGTYRSTFTGSTAGTVSTLTVTVGGVSISTHPTITVTAGAVSGALSTVQFATPSVAMGNTDLVTLVIRDAAGNAIGGLSNSAFAFSLAGASGGTFGSVIETSTKGTYTTNFTGTTAG